MNNLIRYRQLWQLIMAHFKDLIREPAVLFWGIVFPILMSLGLGLAFTQKQEMVREIAVVKNPGTAVVSDTCYKLLRFLNKQTKPGGKDREGNAYSVFTMKDDQMGNTIFHFTEMPMHQAIILLKRGQLNLILSESDSGLRYHFDPLNPDAQLSYLKLVRVLDHRGMVPESDPASIKPLTLKGTRYIDFLVPGLIAMGFMMSCMWGISYGIIDNRSKKLLRRMVATPMRKSHYLIALITVRFGMNFVEAMLLFLFAWLAFGITIQGSVPALMLLFIAGNTAFAGIAIFMSSHTSKTEIGNGLINLVVMPMMVLSGIFFSYHNFPDWSIGFIRNLPLTMLADGFRSIFIEGAGITDIVLPALILTTTGLVFFIAGLKIFKWH
jgi:ABC-2 type transport system permease protein